MKKLLPYLAMILLIYISRKAYINNADTALYGQGTRTMIMTLWSSAVLAIWLLMSFLFGLTGQTYSRILLAIFLGGMLVLNILDYVLLTSYQINKEMLFLIPAASLLVPLYGLIGLVHYQEPILYTSSAIILLLFVCLIAFQLGYARFRSQKKRNTPVQPLAPMQK